MTTITLYPSKFEQQITMAATGYVNCVSGDIGKTVQDDGVALGILISYDNTARTWQVRSATVVAAASVMTISGGTGAGTQSASASLPDAWTNPANALNAHDAACTYRNILAGQEKDMQVDTFLDVDTGLAPAVPVGSTITNVALFVHGSRQNILGGDGGFKVVKGAFTCYVGVKSIYVLDGCAEAVDSDGFNWMDPGWSVADVNTENYTAYCYGMGGTTQTGRAYVDCVWIIVTYTPPATGSPNLVQVM